jgi:DNA-binding CsgD family transcriptional regulator
MSMVLEAHRAPLRGRGAGPSDDIRVPTLSAELAWAVVDQIDYPVLVVDPGLGVHFANRAAAQLLAQAESPWWLDGRQLTTCHAGELEALRLTVEAVALRRTRTLQTLHDAQGMALPVAVIPLTSPTEGIQGQAGACGRVLLMAARADVCDPLSLDAYARASGLTPTENRVMRDLARGMAPAEVAQALKVEVNTVRSHVTSIRTKTGYSSIRHLLTQLGRLPPLSLRLPGERGMCEAAAAQMAASVRRGAARLASGVASLVR